MLTTVTDINTDTIIDIMTDEMEKTEIIFHKLLSVKTSPHHHLMDIAGVSVDGNYRLWVKDGRHNWMEVHDRLIYKNQILSSLHKRLKILFAEKQKV